MNLTQYLQIDGKVILNSDVIYSHINFDKRSNYKKRKNQLEMNFNDNSEEQDKIIHSATITFSDLRALKATVDALDKIFKPIIKKLLEQFPDIHFELMLNDENKSIIENYLHLIACFRNGTPLSTDNIADIHKYLFEMFSEIDDLILRINKTTYNKDISSIKLVNQNTDISDHINYDNRGASEFVHALFNSDLKDLSLATSINLSQKKRTLTKPIQQDQKVFLAKPHVAQGYLDIESKTSQRIRAKGFYVKDNIITNIPFNEIIYCKATGEDKDKYEELFRYIDKELSGKEIVFTVKTLQPYVCIEGVDSKIKHLISIEGV